MTYAHPVMPTPAAPRRRRPWLWATLAAAAAAVLIAGGVGAIWLLAPTDADHAIEYCQEDVIRPGLKSPSTGVFVGEPTVTQRGTIWRVAGEIDAQNSFGATVRASYWCDVQVADGRISLVGHRLDER